jgi:hypothetical protein
MNADLLYIARQLIGIMVQDLTHAEKNIGKHLIYLGYLSISNIDNPIAEFEFTELAKKEIKIVT